MKLFSVIVCSIVLCVISNTNAASLRRSKRQLVPKEFANINIENYLKNDRAVQFQLKCIVYDGPCDRIGKYLKVTIPELLTNQCQNCDPAQRQRAGRLVQHIQQKFPKEWSDAVQKFQGGQVKKEDADKLESLLGVKLDSKLVAEAPSTTTTTAAPSSTTTTTVAPSSSAAPEVTSSTTASSSTTSATTTTTTAVPVVSSEVPVSTSTTTTTLPPAVQTSETPASSVAPQTSSSSVAPPEASSTTTTAPVSSSSAAPPTSEAPKPSVEESSSTTAAPSSSEPTKA